MKENTDYILTSKGNKILIETLLKDSRSSFGEAFTQARKRAGLSQVELARLAGVDRSNLTRFENGKYNPSLEIMVKIAGAMGKRMVISLEDEKCDKTEPSPNVT